jgi:tetratricopeptide (TPR) repeat protein
VLLSSRSNPSHVSRQKSSEYVNAATCASCHADIAKRYSHTGMAHSIYTPKNADMPEDFTRKNTLFHKPSGNYYNLIRRDDGYYQRRYQIGNDGKETNIAEERIDYVIGSGDQARSYLHRTNEGKFIELPVTWYSEKNGYWSMSPGYEGVNQSDFHGVISKECLFCHGAYPAKESPEIEASGEPIFTKELPGGIDCQRCHGPGAEHERAAMGPNFDSNVVRSSIINPARLNRDRQLEVCMECHLSTSGSQDKNISLRAGRSVFSYRPGEPLWDYKLYFDDATEQDKQSFTIVDAAYRLRMSSCFRNSDMTCLTCHDPHNQLHGNEANEHYVQACTKCHVSVEHKVSLPAKETCISCHLPKRRAGFATHVVLTDHYIQRQRPDGDLLASIDASSIKSKFRRGRLALYYPQQLPDDDRAVLDFDVVRAETDRDVSSAAKQLEVDVHRYAPSQANYYSALGRAYTKAGDISKAIMWFEEAVNHSPSDHAAIMGLVEALVAAGDLNRAKTVMEPLVNLPPIDASLLTNLGNVYAQQGDWAAAESVLRKSEMIEPELSQTHNLLGMAREHSGASKSAEESFRTAIRLRPDVAESRVNLARLLTAEGNYDQAENEFNRAIILAPSMADLRHDHGLLLILRKAYPDAAAELRRAIQLAPNRAIYHCDFADLLSQAGKSREANEEYRRALSIDPSLSEANVGLGILLIRQGQTAEDRQYCEKASSSGDPSVQAEIRDCVSRIETKSFSYRRGAIDAHGVKRTICD